MADFRVNGARLSQFITRLCAAVLSAGKQGASNRSRAFTLAAMLVLACGVLLSACSVQQKNLSQDSVVGKLSNKPILDERLANEDFSFPSSLPSLHNGKTLYDKQCLSCHAVSYWQTAEKKNVLAYSTPIDQYLYLTTGKRPEVQIPTSERHEIPAKTHPKSYDKSLTRQERWDVIFYTRYLSGEADFSFTNQAGKPLMVESIFGANCAVCHGKRGFADGPLHSGHPSSHELAAGKVHTGLFQPQPANFHEYKRLYNRTDMQLFKYVAEGIYPSGMPPWYGLKDKDTKVEFDSTLIWKLIKHVRQFAYANDLTDEDIKSIGGEPSGALPGFVQEFSGSLASTVIQKNRDSSSNDYAARASKTKHTHH